MCVCVCVHIYPDYPGLISRLWKELLQINKKKQNIQQKLRQQRFVPKTLKREYPNA